MLQVFQCGLTWAMILKKLGGFEARFEGFEYKKLANWKEKEFEAAMGDPGIVRNKAKVRAAVSNAQAACALDALERDGFVKFCWRHCFILAPQERLLQMGSRSGSYMRASERIDFAEADGVHPTTGVTQAVKAFKAAGFKFLGPCAMLSFMQSVGAVNHHAPDCDAFAPSEAAYALALKSGVAAAAAASGFPALTVGSSKAPIIPRAPFATVKKTRARAAMLPVGKKEADDAEEHISASSVKPKRARK